MPDQAVPIRKLTIYPLALPLRRRVEHAAAQRAIADPLVVVVELADGTVGYGETLPRNYVTGEDTDSVLRAWREDFAESLLEWRPQSFFEALELLEELPLFTPEGVPCPAARAGLELALLDAYLRSYRRTISDVTGWLGVAGGGAPGSLKTARYTLVLASGGVEKIRRHIRLGRLAGIRDFKLKVGMADDAARMGVVRDVLGRSLARGKVTLRVDANGAWDLDAAVAWLKRCADVKLVGVEQPFTREADEDLVPLREQTGVRLIHDESLVTMFDAERLAELGVADAFNVRLSKCGGMLPALRLAEFARGRRIEVQLGCMVGETSILSAAGVRFLEAVPGIRFAEGCFGPLLLQEDVAARSVRFGLAGRPPRLGKSGWGITVEEDRLRRLCVDRPVVMAL